MVCKVESKITISTKYAEKDGVGGFAPNADYATAPGLEPRGPCESAQSLHDENIANEVWEVSLAEKCVNKRKTHEKDGATFVLT